MLERFKIRTIFARLLDYETTQWPLFQFTCTCTRKKQGNLGCFSE